MSITSDRIFQAFHEKKILPKTSAVNVYEYVSYFQPWVEEGYDVVHLCLGGALSVAQKNCFTAAEQLGSVYAVDSCNLSSGMGLLVLKAGEMIREGRSAAEIKAELDVLKGKVHASFILDTLKFMYAGGRCSGVAAFSANMLNIKPCIEVNNADGSMGVGKKYRGSLEKVLVRYTLDKLAQYPDPDLENIFVTYSSFDDHSYVDMVKDAVKSAASFRNIYESRASCTIASHCGPNCLGILFMTK